MNLAPHRAHRPGRIWRGAIGLLLLGALGGADRPLPPRPLKQAPGPARPNGLTPPPPVKPPGPPPCPALRDPEGWFALDAAPPPARSALVGSDVALALGDGGEPWVALVDEVSVRVGRATEDPRTFERVPGLDSVGPVVLGVRGREPVVAAMDPALVFAEHQDAWRVRQLSWLCKPIQLAQGGQSSPGMTIDHAGDLWQACVEAIRGPYRPPPPGPQIPELIHDPYPVVGARLRVARLSGSRWAELPPRPIPARTRAVSLAVTAGGDIDVTLDQQPTPELRIDAKKRAFLPLPPKPAGSSAQPAPAPPPADRPVQRGTRRFGRLHTGGCFQRTCVMTLGIADGDEPWRPLRDAWSTGVSGDGQQATAPAIALDRCSAPVVAWNDGAKNMQLRRWDGQSFRALPAVPGDGPHGLAIDAKGDVLVGAWQPAPAGEAWQLTRLHDDTAEPLPLLTQAVDFVRSIRERTRITLDADIRVTYPRSLGEPPVGFVLRKDKGEWSSDAPAAPLLPAGTPLPYPNQIVPPDFATPDRIYPTRFAAHSALTLDGAGRPLIAWADDRQLHVTAWDGEKWQPVDEATLPEAIALGAPAIAATRERTCIAWASPGLTASVFVRCHRPAP